MCQFKKANFYYLIFVEIYRHLLANRCLSINLMATRVLPSLLPQTVNPSLSLDQFSTLISTLQEMMECIDRNQRNKLKLDHLTVNSPPTNKTNVRHQRSSELVGSVTVRIDARKAASAEDMVGRGKAAVFLRILLGCPFVCLSVCLFLVTCFGRIKFADFILLA